MNITVATTIITINITMTKEDEIVVVSETLYIVSDYLNAIIPNLCTFIEFLCFFILLNNFLRKTVIFCTAYYYILSLGYFFNLVAQIVYIFDIFLPPNYTFGMFAAIIYWYTNLFAGIFYNFCNFQ